jgi:hypothetical protein
MEEYRSALLSTVMTCERNPSNVPTVMYSGPKAHVCDCAHLKHTQQKLDTRHRTVNVAWSDSQVPSTSSLNSLSFFDFSPFLSAWPSPSRYLHVCSNLHRISQIVVTVTEDFSILQSAQANSGRKNLIIRQQPLPFTAYQSMSSINSCLYCVLSTFKSWKITSSRPDEVNIFQFT